MTTGQPAFPAIQVIPVEGLPEVRVGDDLAGLIAEAADLVDGDVVVVTQKVVSKAEDRLVDIDPEVGHKPLVERESVRILRRRGDLIISETEHGFVSVLPEGEGARLFSKLSGDNVGKRMAIILDGNVNSAPVFQEKIPNGIASITLGEADSVQSVRNAQDLVVVLHAGADDYRTDPSGDSGSRIACGVLSSV